MAFARSGSSHVARVGAIVEAIMRHAASRSQLKPAIWTLARSQRPEEDSPQPRDVCVAVICTASEAHELLSQRLPSSPHSPSMAIRASGNLLDASLAKRLRNVAVAANAARHITIKSLDMLLSDLRDHSDHTMASTSLGRSSDVSYGSSSDSPLLCAQEPWCLGSDLWSASSVGDAASVPLFASCTLMASLDGSDNTLPTHTPDVAHGKSGVGSHDCRVEVGVDRFYIGDIDAHRNQVGDKDVAAAQLTETTNDLANSPSVNAGGVAGPMSPDVLPVAEGYMTVGEMTLVALSKEKPQVTCAHDVEVDPQGDQSFSLQTLAHMLTTFHRDLHNNFDSL